MGHGRGQAYTDYLEAAEADVGGGALGIDGGSGPIAIRLIKAATVKP